MTASYSRVIVAVNELRSKTVSCVRILCVVKSYPLLTLICIEICVLFFLELFFYEPVKEEKNADDLIKKMELFGDDSKGLYSLDAEYATRIYTAPSLVLD